MYKLRELNIEGNNVGDALTIKICEAMLERPLLESLNLSHNVISNRGALAIANMLKSNITLVGLFIRWNNIQAKGAAALWDSLRVNVSLKIFEMSFNPIGVGMKSGKQFGKVTEETGDQVMGGSEGKDVSACESFKEMFKMNKTLIHCDFSYWDFSFYECKVMNEGLEENHTILGLHMLGNKMNVDSLGFLKYDDLLPSTSHFPPNLNKTLETENLPDSKLYLKSASNWWICEGWTQASFKFDPYSWNNPPDKELTSKDSVFIHLSIENYQPDSMSIGKNKHFYITRMVPPIGFNYYFTINGVPKYAMDVGKEANKKSSVDFSPMLQFSKDKSINIRFTNIPSSITRTKELIDQKFLDKLEWFPRPKRQNLVIFEEDKTKNDLSLKDTVFWE
jgi:hypothetical protein